MLLWTSIGFIVGSILGLTGSGGGLISIPLFMHLVGMDLRRATIFSLLAVIIGAIINWVPQYKQTLYKVGLTIFSFSLISSYLVSGIKDQIPSFVISISLALISIYSLYSFWKGKKGSLSQENLFQFNLSNSFKVILSGLVLGLLTTLTGLGGGVLLIPILVGILKLDLKRAIPTSLFTIATSSLGSFWFQRDYVLHELEWKNLVTLIIGTLIASYLITILASKIPENIFFISRKICFTLVVIIALMGLIP